MNYKCILAASLIVATSVSISWAQDVTINSWSDLNSHAKDYTDHLIIKSNISPDQHIKVGEWDSTTKGSWYLDGGNHKLEVNYQNNGFSIENNITSFVFKNMNMVNFKNDGSSGGVFWNGGNGGQILSSYFNHNGAKDGGVLYNTAGISLIQGTTFYDSFVNNGNGGAIYNNSGATIALIENSHFRKNQVYDGGNGGAIYNEGKITEIKSTDFGDEGTEGNRNIAKDEGGAIYNASQGTIDKINNSGFYYNGVNNDGKNGGAINNQGKIKTITESKFKGNGKGVNGTTQNASVGGAIYNNGTIGENDSEGIINSTFEDNLAKCGGGAIFNDSQGKISKIISSVFKKNYSGDEGGGAIKNKGKIGKITESTFDSNSSDTKLNGTLDSKGAAIYNSDNGTIDEISNSTFTSNTSEDYGGAIGNNKATITKITGNTFGDENDTSKGNKGSSGGAINNQGGVDSGDNGKATISEISNSNFYNNKAEEANSYPRGNGGAISNHHHATITKIVNSIFKGNNANGLKKAEVLSQDSEAHGGAIYNNNDSTIGEITNSTFENNFAHAEHNSSSNHVGRAFGGAIYNGENSKIGKIVADFSGNYAKGTNAFGGAIYNDHKSNGIGEVYGTFKNNYTQTEETKGLALGGAIYTGKDLTLAADGSDEKKANTIVSGNYTKQLNGTKDNNGIFVETGNNSTNSYKTKLTLKAINGGNIQIDDKIDGGKVSTTSSSTTVTRDGHKYDLNIDGDSTGVVTLNGQIINGDTTLKNVLLKLGVDENNTSNVLSDSSTTFKAESGAITFIDNKISNYNINKLTSSDTKWSADIDWKTQTADTITLSDNASSGKVKLSSLNSLNTPTKFEQKDYVFQILKGVNGTKEKGNVELDISDLDIKNIGAEGIYYTEVYSDTVLTSLDSNIKLGTTDTHNDSIIIDGIIYNTLEYISELETHDHEAKFFEFDDGLPVYAYSNKTELDVAGNLTISGEKGNYIDFQETTDFTVSKGSSLNVENAGIVNANGIDNDGKVKFSGSVLANFKTLTNDGYAEFDGVNFGRKEDTKDEKIVNNGKNETTQRAKRSLYNAAANEAPEQNGMKFSNTNVTVAVENNGDLEFSKDNNILGGVSGEDGNMKLSKGTQNIASNIENQSIKNEGATTNIYNSDNLSDKNNSLEVIEGTINLYNLGSKTLKLSSLSMKGGEIYIPRVDVDLASKTMGRITAEGGSYTSGTITVQDMNLLSDSLDLVTPVQFADTSVKQAVKSGVREAEGPVYRYTVDYVSNGGYGDGGYFVYSRKNGMDGYNPSVLSVSVANLAANWSSLNETFKYVFEHQDSFTKLPLRERLSKINKDKYSIAEEVIPHEQLKDEGAWVRPYTTFESIDLKNGPSVDAITYGTVVGIDGDFKRLKKGWYNVGTGYIGYIGSTIDYKGVDSTINGGLIGATESFYKGNFFTAITLSAGATAGETSSKYGDDEFSSLLAGVGTKTGYNFEFLDGKLILQPLLFLSYTYVNTFDYTSATGAKIESDPLHTVQVNPSVRLIGNLNGGWQPYLSAGFVYNVLSESSVTAGNIVLPHMSIKPYAEYGVGIQRNWKDRLTAFGQAMVRSGGRKGVALTFGLRFAIGKDHANKKKENL